jgi:hypothetical protein
MAYVDCFVGGANGRALIKWQATAALPTLPRSRRRPTFERGMEMTYAFNPRLFVENGPTIAAQAVHRRHEMIRAALAAPASRPAEVPAPANLDAPVCGVIRFAL